MKLEVICLPCAFSSVAALAKSLVAAPEEQLGRHPAGGCPLDDLLLEPPEQYPELAVSQLTFTDFLGLASLLGYMSPKAITTSPNSVSSGPTSVKVE